MKSMFAGKARKRRGSTKVVLVTLDNETHAAVQSLAQAQQISMSAIMRGWALEKLGRKDSVVRPGTSRAKAR